MGWRELENGLVCKGGVRAKGETHPSVNKQVQISKCKVANVQQYVSKCQYPNVSKQV